MQVGKNRKLEQTRAGGTWIKTTRGGCGTRLGRPTVGSAGGNVGLRRKEEKIGTFSFFRGRNREKYGDLTFLAGNQTAAKQSFVRSYF